MRQQKDENHSNMVKKALFAMAAIMLVLPATAPATEIGFGIDFNGNMRWRMEFDGKDFSNSTAMNELSYLRSRLNLKVTSIENTLVYLQLQDSRNLGTNSSGLNNDTNLGVHQAYLKLSDILANGLSMQFGRFEAPYGRHRLMGNVGWHNVGRTFDGVRTSYTEDAFNVDFFCLKIVERSFTGNHKDWKLYGLYGTFMEKSLDVFFLYDWDMEETGGDYRLARFTAGTYFKHKMDSGLEFEFDAAFQGGTDAVDDISAFMIAGDMSYSLESVLEKVGFGFDITSGDDDLGDHKVKSFDNLYYTGHKFRGFMDQFLGTAITGLSEVGLMDLILRGTIKVNSNDVLLVDIHHFQTMQNYDLAGDGTSKALGQEIDLTYKHKMQKGLGFQGGLSMFLASDDWRPDSDSAFWLYAMVTAGF